MSLFLTVIGLIYGLISAFTINNAWERFSKIRDGVAEELSSLTTSYILTKRFSDKRVLSKIKAALISYCEEAPKIEWHEYWKSESTHKKFRNIMEIIADAKIRNEKDSVLFDQVTDEISNATKARSQQLVLAQTRVTKMQWVLNIFLSGVLITGLLLLNIPDYNLAIFVTTTMIASVLLILMVIYQVDRMKIAEQEVSIEPYRQIIKLIKSESRSGR
ncbi:MAG: DUF4239 domain-containing protein [Planctomycetes bacterium]|nr:DUF4239 domain-containing protein [Planctomycetota bacterium]